MKRLLLTLLFCLLPALSWAGLPYYYTEVSATSTSSTVTVDLDSANDKALTLIIANDGTKSIYVNLDGAPATTSNLKLLTLETLTLNDLGPFAIHTLSIVTNGSDTSTVRVMAFPTRGTK